MSITIIGSNLQTPWNNAPLDTTPSSTDSPNPTTGFPFRFGAASNLRTYDPFSPVATWNPNVPLLSGLSVNEVIALLNDGTIASNFSIQISITYRVTQGSQGADCSSTPVVNLNAYSSIDVAQLFSTNIFANGGNNYCSTVCPSFTYNYPSVITPRPAQILQAISYNTTCSNYPINNFTLQTEMVATLRVSCITGPQLGTNFCMKYCQAEENLRTCVIPYENYCFASTTGDPNTIPLVTDPACQTFFKQYYGKLGPDADLDTKISAYCTNKFTNCFEPLLFGQPPISDFEQDLCACHLSNTCYDNYVESISSAAPAFANYLKISEIREQCLLSRCASSVFTTVAIGRTCPIPGCIEVVNFTNDGEIRGGVSINQKTVCQTINNTNGESDGGGTNGANGSNGTDGDKSFWDRNWLWFVIGIGFLLVLIITILIIVGSENSKKKSPLPFKYD